MPYTIIPETCNGDGACKRVCPSKAISGESKQPHSINPESCIECGACGRICPRTAVKDRMGRVCTMIKKSAWEKPEFHKKKCMSCNICIDACPTGCLALAGAEGKDKHGRPYVKNEKACIGCGFCAQACPVDAIVMRAPAAAAV
jgi:NAD-dependent dihydropyrimidine dehydrogenase PreA subunit